MLESRRGWLARSGCTVIAAAVVARAGTRSGLAQNALPLTIAMAHTVDATPFYYALRTGSFERAGLAVTLNAMASGNLSIQAVVAGAAQIGLANTLSESQAHQRGIPLVLIAGAGVYDTNAPIARLYVTADSPIRTAKDLEGRVVAVSGLHDLLSMSVRAWLTQQGADSANVRFIELPQAAMAPALLEQKRVEAIALFEPFASAIDGAGGARVLARPYDAIAKAFNVTAWFTHATWLAANRATVTRFQQTMRQATEYANAHLVDMIPVVAGYTGMTPDVVKQALRVKTAPVVLPAQLQPLIDAAAKVGELTAPFPARELLAGAP
jgi:NitT/TauT family transport system substrate-binding protein